MRIFNRLRTVLSRRISYANAFEVAMKSHPDHVLFHMDEPLDYPTLPDREITVRQVYGFVNRVANVLKQAGLVRYDRVIIYKTNSPDYFLFAQAIVRAGGVAVPVNGGMAAKDLTGYADYTGSKFIVTDAATFERNLAGAEGLKGRTFVFPRAPVGFEGKHVDLSQALPTASEELVPVEPAKDEPILLVHTSGTTGFPKAVIHTTESHVAALKRFLLFWAMPRKSRYYVASPFNHYVTNLKMFTALVGGFAIYARVGAFDAERGLQLMEREKIEVYFGFPDTFLEMYKHGLEKYQLDSMRMWEAAADAMHEVHVKAFTQKGAFLRIFGLALLKSVFIDTLGTSEVGFVALMRLAFSFTKLFARCVGRTLPFSVRSRIADETGRTLKRGQVGRLMVAGPTLFRGYWNAHDKALGCVIDGWWWTGDVGYQDRLGRFYQIDREVDSVATPTGRVYTLLVEEELLKHPDVLEAAVIGLPCGDSELPVAFVHGRDGVTVDAEACLKWINQRLLPTQRMAKVVTVAPSDLPRGLTGKVLKRRMRDRYKGLLEERLEARRAA